MAEGKWTRITWVSIEFDHKDNVTVQFDRSIFVDGWVRKNHRWKVRYGKGKKRKLKRLIKALSLCSYKQQVILKYDGYSLYFER